jgi:hypothetical protein
MKKHIYKCTLLSDVVISSTAATEEKHQTLHYIPGSYFLGVVAGKYYGEKLEKEDSDKAYALFHEGAVHYGDAHLSVDGTTKTLKTPLNLFEFKDKPNSPVWKWHEKETAFEKHPNAQPKQIRKGYTDGSCIVEPERDFNLRTAISDGTAKEGALFGYESLRAGQTFVFEIISNEDAYLNLVKAALTGNQRIGRSRSAAYGLVNIEWLREEANESVAVKKGEKVTVYAEGNLVFYDENGYPSLTPTAAQLGVPYGKLLPEYTQMQTRNFALYNSKRVSRDAHLYIIEKGSVFTIEATEDAVLTEKLVGGHIAPGFGKVRYNVPFQIQKTKDEVTDAEKTIKWQPAFEIPVKAHDAAAIEGLLQSKQLDAELKASRQALDRFKNRREFKEIAASQWSSLMGILDDHNRDYLNSIRLNEPTEKGSKNPIDNARKALLAFITSDQRRLKWEESGAKKQLEVVLSEANKLESWPLVFEALRHLFKKLRAQ